MSTSDSELENSDSFLVSQAILGILVSTPAVVANVLLLVTVFRDPNRDQPLWGSPVTLLVVNLAMCDLLSGAIPGYFSLYYDIAIITGQPKEELFGVRTGMIAAGVVTNIVSSCTIAAMSLDRLFAVSSPHQYTARVTKAKIKIFIAVVWIYSVLFSSLGRMGVSVTLVVVLYCHIHVSACGILTYRVRWHNIQVRNLADEREKIDVVPKRRKRKTVSAFLLVLISFYLTFLPQYIAQNIHQLSQSLAGKSIF